MKLRVVGVAFVSFGIGAAMFVGWHLTRPVQVSAPAAASTVPASDAATPLVALDEPVASLAETKATAAAPSPAPSPTVRRRRRRGTCQLVGRPGHAQVRGL